MVIIMKNKEELYYCFRYHCNYCPKAKECEERDKKKSGDINAHNKTRKVCSKSNKRNDSKRSI
jgi:hypothetical protein